MNTYDLSIYATISVETRNELYEMEIKRYEKS